MRSCAINWPPLVGVKLRVSGLALTARVTQTETEKSMKLIMSTIETFEIRSNPIKRILCLVARATFAYSASQKRTTKQTDLVIYAVSR